MSQGTRCHQLGLYIVLDSPLNMLCDSPTNYLKEMECTHFIAAIPTVWDETRILAGEIGEYIVTARRKGSTWYIGGITDWTPPRPEGRPFVPRRNPSRRALPRRRECRPQGLGLPARGAPDRYLPPLRGASRTRRRLHPEGRGRIASGILPTKGPPHLTVRGPFSRGRRGTERKERGGKGGERGRRSARLYSSRTLHLRGGIHRTERLHEGRGPLRVVHLQRPVARRPNRPYAKVLS